MITSNISMALSARYQGLVKEVLDRLPGDWHGNTIVRLEESRETFHLAHGWPAVACAARLQFKADEVWVVTLYTSCLDTLSDESVRWIVARELGRVLSEERNRLLGLKHAASTQEKAEALAIEWGFASDRQRFNQEYLLPRAS